MQQPQKHTSNSYKESRNFSKKQNKNSGGRKSMTFEYPKQDRRKTERIMFRIDKITYNQLKYLAELSENDTSKIIRQCIKNHLKKIAAIK